MKSERIALLLNAFVMPGSGQILLGQRLKGYAIGFLVLLFVTLPLVRYTITVMSVLEAPAKNEAALASSLNALSMAWHTDRAFILWCLAAVVLLWLYGIVDLLVFRQKDRSRSQAQA